MPENEPNMVVRKKTYLKRLFKISPALKSDKNKEICSLVVDPCLINGNIRMEARSLELPKLFLLEPPCASADRGRGAESAVLLRAHM